MIYTPTEILSVLATLVVFTESIQLCNLECRAGEHCQLVRSTCDYPPCPKVPICVGGNIPEVHRPEIHRPGVCPIPMRNLANYPCVTQCRSDGDCQTNEKCCSNGCGRLCRRVVQVNSNKPGTCPWHLGREAACGEQCSQDNDCIGNEKCCSTACGSRCSKPCYNWLRSGAGARFWSLPFNCRRG